MPVEPRGPVEPQGPAEPRAPVELRGLRVLVVEDEFLVAMDLELMLQALGCEVVGPIGDLARAQRAAAEERLDVALLDVNIGGQPVTAVADAAGRARRADGVLHRLPGREPARPLPRGADVDEAVPADRHRRRAQARGQRRTHRLIFPSGAPSLAPLGRPLARPSHEQAET